MAQYKVPQDVEADDKLLGPFSFRQFVYLLIAGGLIALAVGLFQLFPLLALIPVPFILLLGALALPLKKDQPMETYLAAIVSYYLKPRTRIWTPGQRESTIIITVPKQKEETRTRDITGEEATHRLSFLADIVDTEGYAIKGAGVRRVSEDLVAEANATMDMFEARRPDTIENAIVRDENERHEKVMQEMREEIERSENMVQTSMPVNGGQGMPGLGSATMLGQEMAGTDNGATTDSWAIFGGDGGASKPNFDSAVVVVPGSEVKGKERAHTNVVRKEEKKSDTIKAKPSIIELANNPDYTIATISKEANRIKERDEGEVFISLH